MRFASLGSGSRGNALLVEAKNTRLLLDCGFGLREALRRLGRLGIAPHELTAILVTHEHTDHAGGVFHLAEKYALPVWLTHGTLSALEERQRGAAPIQVIDQRQSYTIGDLQISPYTVPHDAREPVQFVFTDGASRLGVLTDAGSLTPHLVAALDGVDALVLECNHDPDLLAASSYPPFLKRRVAGSHGHLDNASAAALLGRIDRRRLQHVVAAHLSAENNRPHLASAALAAALDCSADWIGIADQETGFAWRQLRAA